MRIMKLTTSIVLLACLLGLVCTAATTPADPPKKPPQKEQPLSFWMEKKMEYSQDILRGLVRGDFEKVAEKAEQMRVVSKIEGWIRGKKPGYRAQLQVFEFANNEILRQSRAKNLEGTTMAFQQMTASCVSCHRILRETNGDSERPAKTKKRAD